MRGQPLSPSCRLRVRECKLGCWSPFWEFNFSGVGKWQVHIYSNQQRHSETFSFQWDWRVKPVILSGRHFEWIMKGCVLSACFTEGKGVRGTMFLNSSVHGLQISAVDLKLWLNQNPRFSPVRSRLVLGLTMLLCFKNARIVSNFYHSTN